MVGSSVQELVRMSMILWNHAAAIHALGMGILTVASFLLALAYRSGFLVFASVAFLVSTTGAGALLYGASIQMSAVTGNEAAWHVVNVAQPMAVLGFVAGAMAMATFALAAKGRPK